MNLGLVFNPKIMWLGFVIIMILFGIISIALFYHWLNFSYKPQKVKLMSSIYLTGSFIFLGLILFGIISYFFSI